MTILVIADHSNDLLKNETLKTLAAAQQIAAHTQAGIHALIAGDNIADAAQELAKADGVNKVLVADNEVYKFQLAENISELIVRVVQENIGQYSHVLTSATTTGKNLLPRVAALLNVEQISEIITVESADTFKRPIYAGNAIATVRSSNSIHVLSVRTSAFDAVTTSNHATVSDINTVTSNNASCFIDEALTRSDRPELTAASTIISGGRGMKNGENFILLENIADKLGAAVGASRAAVDAGFVSNDMQVGQTGKIVAPNLYIAVGISGAIQHLAGMKDSNVIVAINSDEEAPIFQVADYGLVGDLFELLPELESLL